MASNSNDTTSSDLFSPIGFGGAYGRTTDVLFLRWAIYVAVSLLILPVLFFVQWTSAKITEDTKQAQYDGESNSNTLLAESLAFLLEIVLFLFIDILAKGTLTVATLETYTKGTSTTKLGLMDCARQAVRFVCPLFCTGLVVELILWLATVIVVAIAFPLVFLGDKPVATAVAGVLIVVAFLVAVVYACVPLLLLYPVIIHENLTGPMGAIRRCYALASGRRIYLGCTLFLALLVAIASRIALEHSGLGPLTQNLLTCLVSIIAMPLLTILTVVVYMDLRVKREELTEQMEQAAVADNKEDQGDETEITEIHGDNATESNYGQVV